MRAFGADNVSAEDALVMVERAMTRGALLYNRGHPDACATVYAAVAQRILQRTSELVGPVVTEKIREAIQQAELVDNPSQRAWTLRRGLDEIGRR